jgi:hypothetical protein
LRNGSLVGGFVGFILCHADTYGNDIDKLARFLRKDRVKECDSDKECRNETDIF